MRPPLPAALFESGQYWRAGADGVLKIQRCQSCQMWINPPRPVCRWCLSTELTFEPVSGLGTIYTFTINRTSWLPDQPVPMVFIVAQLDEGENLRIFAPLRDVDVETVAIGQRVQVAFEQVDDLHMPVFKKALL